MLFSGLKCGFLNDRAIEERIALAQLMRIIQVGGMPEPLGRSTERQLLEISIVRGCRWTITKLAYRIY